MRWPWSRKREERLSIGSGGGWPLASFVGGYGGAVSPQAAESLATVLACVELISGTIAALPASLLIDTPKGSQEAPASSPAWRVLQRPNAFQSWPAFMSWLVASVLLRGNGLARIDTDARGAVTGLTPIPWAWVVPSVIGSPGGAPRLVYDVTVRTPEADALGLSGQRLLADDVLHVRARSDTGLIGRSVLSRAAAPVAEALEVSTLVASNWKNGMRPSGLLSAPSYLTPEQRKRKDEWLAEYSSSLNAGRTPLIEGGWKYEQMAISSVDAELLNSRKFSTAELCRLFLVPEILLQQETRIPTDISQYMTLLVQMALAPLVESIEAEFDAAVLGAGSGLHLEMDADGLARGNFAATVSALAALKQSGICTANDCREALGWPPIAGGDVLQSSSAPAWPSDKAGLPAAHPSPGPRGPDGLPEPGTNAGKGSGRGNGSAHA